MKPALENDQTFDIDGFFNQREKRRLVNRNLRMKFRLPHESHPT
jgi:hypothetical protein